MHTIETPRRKLPKQVWMLGFVSLFMDTSSELIHSLLPAIFITLGIPMSTIGIIEGLAEAMASIVKVFSGALSDRLGKRKILAVAGYGLAAASKPIFPLATSAFAIFTARIIDRIGKGIRGAPRDALIADVTPENQRGAAYGLRQSLDTVGAFAGPVFAILLMYLLSDQIKLVLWFSVIPAIICMVILVFLVKDSNHNTGETRPNKVTNPFRNCQDLSHSFWWLVAIGGVFTLSRFSEAFLALRCIDLGLPLALSPVALLLLSFIYALSAYPAGKMADKWPKSLLLMFGIVFLIIADFLLGLANHLGTALAGITFWGLHMGFTQGVLAAMVATVSPKHLRGTAFGVFNLVSGLGLLFASFLAGILWYSGGASLTFFVGAGIAVFCLCMVFVVTKKYEVLI